MPTVEAFCNVHSHIRQPEYTDEFVRYGIQGGADVILPMPNTKPELTTAGKVMNYTVPLANKWHRSMRFIDTVMLTEQTSSEEIDECVANEIEDGKIYPLNRTTQSENGVRDYYKLVPVVRHCGTARMKVHLHPEHPNMDIGQRDAEYLFVPIVDMFLRETDAIIIVEHITDARCIPIWKKMAKQYPGRFFVTITAHHLATYEDHVFGDVRSVCKPPIRTEQDMLDLRALVAENHSWVMAGADDAPHDNSGKHVHEGKCACGAYTAPFALQLYAHALKDILQTDNGIQTFINFTSRNARMLHGLPSTTNEFELVEEPFLIPANYHIVDWIVEPFWAGRTIDYTLKPFANI